jgi:hypothetical protein
MSEEVQTGITSGWLLVALGLSLLAGYLAHVIGGDSYSTIRMRWVGAVVR